MPAVPALIMAGTTIGSSLLSSKIAGSAASQASQRSPEELAYMNSQTDLANQMRGQGQQAFGSAMPAIRSTLDYYQSLLNGDRQARMNAVSGEAQDTTAAYQGGANNIKRNLRGGERDQALAENATSRAGAISRLVTGVRPGAAAASAQVGQGLLGAAGGFENSAAGIQGNLLSNSTYNRQQGNAYGQQAGADAGQNLGRLFGQLLPLLGGGGVKGASKLSGAGPYAGGYQFQGDSTPGSLLDR